MENVYCISLEKNKPTWNAILKNIKINTGFENVKMFPAIQGSDLEKYYKNNEVVSQPINDIISKHGDVMSLWARYKLHTNENRREHAQFGSWGAVGCYLSHASLWEMVVNQNLDHCLIFEDDVVFEPDFVEKYNKVINYIPSDTDIFFLDISWCEKSEKYNELLDKITGKFFGMHAYIITNAGAKKLLKHIFPIEVQIDSYIAFSNIINKNINMYYAKNICGQIPHVSSIQTDCKLCDAREENINVSINPYMTYLVLLTFIAIIIYASKGFYNRKQK